MLKAEKFSTTTFVISLLWVSGNIKGISPILIARLGFRAQGDCIMKQLSFPGSRLISKNTSE